MSTDRISDMLSMLRNASMVGNSSIETFYSKECEAIAKVLKTRSFLREVKVFKPSKRPYKMLHLDLNTENIISSAKRISRPGRRIYRGTKGLKRIAGGNGVLVVSTSLGVMDGEVAKKKKLGGEVLCEVK